MSASLVPVIYTCRLEQRDGRWYAGLSRTTDTLLSNTHVGLEVAEAQCLLRRAGTAPGDIDGVFGPKTAGGPTHGVSIRNKDDAATFVYTEMTEVRPGSTVRACFQPTTTDGERECIEARVGEAATTARPPSPQ